MKISISLARSTRGVVGGPALQEFWSDTFGDLNVLRATQKLHGLVQELDFELLADLMDLQETDRVELAAELPPSERPNMSGEQPYSFQVALRLDGKELLRFGLSGKGGTFKLADGRDPSTSIVLMVGLIKQAVASPAS